MLRCFINVLISGRHYSYMKTIIQTWKIAVNGIRRMIVNARFYVALLWGSIFMQQSTVTVRQFSIEKQVKCGIWILPHLLDNMLLQIMIVLGSVLIFCDAPFITAQTKDYLIRSGRKKWFWGQISYIVVISFLYAVGLMVISILLLFPSVEFSMDWGKVINTLAQYDGSGIFKDLIQGYTPILAMWLSLLAIWVNSIFIGTFVMAVNVYVQKSIGPTVGAVVAFSPYLLIRMARGGNLGYYISPPTWIGIRIYNQYNGMDSPTIGYVYRVWFLLIIIAIVFTYWKIKRYDFNRLPEM